MNVQEEIYSIPQLPSPDWLRAVPASEQKSARGVARAYTFEKAIALVRAALLAPRYRIEMESASEEFWRCVISRPAPDPEAAAHLDGVLERRITDRFGSEWFAGLTRGREIVRAAALVAAQTDVKLGLIRGSEAADRRARLNVRGAVAAYEWAFLAAQIAAAERIPLSLEVQGLLEDDLSYRPRELYLAICACRFHRGGVRHGWLAEVYALAAEGHGGSALGLLFDGIADVIGPGGRPAEFFACLDWAQLTTGLVRGVLTATAAVPELEGRAAFERQAAMFLDLAYGREPRGG